MSEKQPGNIYNISGKQLANAAKIRDFRNRVLLAESAKEDRDYTDSIIGIIYSLCEQMLPAVEETVRVSNPAFCRKSILPPHDCGASSE